MTTNLDSSPLSKFESSIKTLEEIIEQMESEDISLEDSLAKYQQGVKLVSFCQQQLADVSQKIKILDGQTNSLQEFNID